jgi:3-hydroxybutyryl-CoA dehydrogenase
MKTPPFKTIGVVGSGVMGRGIVQLFAQAGATVRVFDNQAKAVDAALTSLADTFSKLAEKGRLSAQAAQDTMARILPALQVSELADCELVIEAIVERLDIKRELFAQLEAVLSDQAVLASNTSSLSITAIAAGCKHPERVAGFHFFNPVPLMKIVEVIGGPRTRADVLERLCQAARQAGHTAVLATDAPGFIVNHAGRGFGTEALKVLGEGVADTLTIDRIMREQIRLGGNGFRLGPFELLDLTGLDVSHPVMESIYRQFYEEPRFRPSAIGAQRSAAGLIGRKVGEGFYRYVDGKALQADEPTPPTLTAMPTVWVAPGPAAAELASLVQALGAHLESGPEPSAQALIVLSPLGLDATTACQHWDARRAVAIDTLFPFGYKACQRRTIMSTPATLSETRATAQALFSADGARVAMIRDSAGFVSQRIVALIVAIGCEIAQNRIASPQDIDAAVRLGLGYPVGPLSMGDEIGPAKVVEILRGLHAVTGDPRYRPSLWLQRRAKLGLSLLQDD